MGDKSRKLSWFQILKPFFIVVAFSALLAFAFVYIPQSDGAKYVRHDLLKQPICTCTCVESP